jgi:hypothetical protein
MTKQLFIVYDKQYKYLANQLYNLLSQHPEIKSSLYTEKEIKKLVSREKCLYIGAKCSSMIGFSDSYNELGIHIGCVGAKAWIRCFQYEWNVDRLNEFENMLKSFTYKYNLKSKYDWYEKVSRVYINQDFQKGYEPWPGNAIKRIKDKNIMNSGSDRFDDVFDGICHQLLLGGKVGKLFNRVFNIEPTIRWFQYLVGVLKFYEDYLNDFLELSDSNKESNVGDTITESEKKN